MMSLRKMKEKLYSTTNTGQRCTLLGLAILYVVVAMGSFLFFMAG